MQGRPSSCFGLGGAVQSRTMSDSLTEKLLGSFQDGVDGARARAVESRNRISFFLRLSCRSSGCIQLFNFSAAVQYNKWGPAWIVLAGRLSSPHDSRQQHERRSLYDSRVACCNRFQATSPVTTPACSENKAQTEEQSFFIQQTRPLHLMIAFTKISGTEALSRSLQQAQV